jgi:hypothetical protein
MPVARCLGAVTIDNVRGYILKGSVDAERILVIKTEDIELLYSLVKRMGRMRDERLKQLGRALEGELNGK